MPQSQARAEMVETVTALRARVADWHAQGLRVGLVPTMGALHEGHASLMRIAAARADRVVATIFVNPTQFNDPADLAKYPRSLEADLGIVAQAGGDLVFVPDVAEMYPEGFATRIGLGGPALPLEGTHRPGHFDGMATVVAKLFNISRADLAVFGQKDFQQLCVVRRMVRDLDMPIEIVGAPTVREADGLALSSRNRRLSPEAREIAAILPATLDRACRALRAGKPAPAVLDEARKILLAKGFSAVDYIALVDAVSLDAITFAAPGARLLAAASVDGIRLIDAVEVETGVTG